ncbi:MAG: hypothetical protein HXY50_16525 [Ignavibacteriaceae bacterium]|nr:hypothetical protein [Ignavibacteriaceae bacterium]
MTHDKVKNILNDYFDENLDIEVDIETQNHISECADCSQYLYSLQDLMNKVEKLPRSLKPHVDYWQDIFHEMSSIKTDALKQQEEIQLKEAGQQIKQDDTDDFVIEQKKIEAEDLLNWEKKKVEYLTKLKTPQVRNTLIGVLSACLIFFLYITFFLKGPSWEVKKFQVSGSTHEILGELPDDGIIKSDAITRFEIHTPSTGVLTIAPNSRIQKLQTDKVQLYAGALTANKENATKPLTIVVPSAEIKDFFVGGHYRAVVDDNNITSINVSDGWVSIIFNDIETIVLSNHTCKIHPDSGMGLPYLNTSSTVFIDAVNNYCFQNPNNEEALIAVLTKAEKSNVLTLWNLLKRVSRKQRDMVIYTMFGLLGDPPIGVTDEGLRSLNPEMMQKLIEEIEPEI